MIIKTLPKALSFAQKAKEVVKGERKKTFWQEVADALKEGESAIIGYHVGGDEILEYGIHPYLRHPLGEGHKGGGLFFGRHPFLSLTQKKGGVFVTPTGRHIPKTRYKYYRAILTPKQMYEVEEPRLRTLYKRYAPEFESELDVSPEDAWDYVTRAVGDLMKLTKADKRKGYFQTKGVVEYVVKDPSIIRFISTSSRPIPRKMIQPRPLEALEDFISRQGFLRGPETVSAFKSLLNEAIEDLQSIIKRPSSQFLEVASYPKDYPPEYLFYSDFYRNKFLAVADRVDDLVSRLLKMEE